MHELDDSLENLYADDRGRIDALVASARQRVVGVALG